jgi:hypothetical protein
MFNILLISTKHNFISNSRLSVFHNFINKNFKNFNIEKQISIDEKNKIKFFLFFINLFYTSNTINFGMVCINMIRSTIVKLIIHIIY